MSDQQAQELPRGRAWLVVPCDERALQIESGGADGNRPDAFVVVDEDRQRWNRAAARLPEQPDEGITDRLAANLIEATDLMMELVKGYKIDEAAEWLKARGFMYDDEPDDTSTLAGLLFALESEALAARPTVPEESA